MLRFFPQKNKYIQEKANFNLIPMDQFLSTLPSSWTAMVVGRKTVVCHELLAIKKAWKQ